VVDIDFSKDWPGIWPQRTVDLGSPTATNELCGDEIPNSAIPLLINGIALYRV
jgi:hypothetical protein